MHENSSPSIFRKESLERLSSPEQLDQLMQVVSPRSWLPLASLGILIGLALLWSVLARIPITAVGKGLFVRSAASSGKLVGLTYFNPEEVGQIQPGMRMLLLPNRAGGEMGGVMARVTTVSEPSVTTLEAARQTDLLNQESLIEVVAELEQELTGEGYQVSTRDGSAALAPGMMATARITLKEKAPIAFVFPFFEGSQ